MRGGRERIKWRISAGLVCDLVRMFPPLFAHLGGAPFLHPVDRVIGSHPLHGMHRWVL